MSRHSSSDLSDNAMDTASDSTTSTAPIGGQLMETLHSIQSSIARMQEQVEAAAQPLESALHRIEQELAHIKEQLADSNTAGMTKPNRSAVKARKRESSDMIINPLQMPVDRITTADRYIPAVDLNHVHEGQHKNLEALKELSFEEKALMSSETIERNELYNDTYVQLQKMESKFIHGVLSVSKSSSIPIYLTDRKEFVTMFHHEISQHDQYKRLQSDLLRLRIQRYRVEAIVAEITRSVSNPLSSTSGARNEGDVDARPEGRAETGNEGGSRREGDVDARPEGRAETGNEGGSRRQTRRTC
ncbi:hypothetical protein PTTG_00404 [Puccinia triticina 1-1 BBBD Race 1]|uniref:Uncharacterized protein n=1 Tax=Puccinia triticina (isolate 1-1 / race 1 (BBBD)) TaxID=630390 RepID=A0A180G610_PUCT1|nr:hypothetical protein PTTG_00404 [Puccinia triticina 1-1 BBBD Race 1]